MRRPRGRAGFSLVEVLVATGMAALMAASVTAAFSSAQRAGAAARAVDRRQAAAAALWEQLRALPYCEPAAGGAGTLLQRVFPHADSGLNNSAARFSPEAADDRPAGTFFTSVAVDGVYLNVAATFCATGPVGWQPVAPEMLAGYSPWLPPAAHVLVSIRAVDDGAASGALMAVMPDRPPASAGQP